MIFSSTMRRVLAPVAGGLFYLANNRRGRPLTSEELRTVHLSFSQFGEDLAVLRLASDRGIQVGTYADFGAFHPVLHSNTLLLNQRGWKGLNVDASADAIQLFDSHRREDCNVVALLSDREEELTFAEYGYGTTNRIVAADDASDRKSLVGESPQKIHKMKSVTARSLLESSPFRAGVDYVNVDCEGHDLEVLRGLDLSIYRPSVISIETEMSAQGQDIMAYCEGHGYSVCEVHHVTSVFVRNDIR